MNSIMTKQTINASEAAKKAYSKPELKVYKVTSIPIIATSANTEEYEQQSTDSWYQ